MTITKLRVAVLFGGSSHEKEVSLDSGRNIVYKLSTQKYEITPIFVTSKFELYTLTTAQLVYNSTHEIEHSLQPSQKINWSDLAARIDFVFIGLHGGMGENGALQGALEMLDIPYNGSGVLPSALCMNKYKTTQYLRSQGLDVPTSVLIAKDQWQHNKEAELARITQQLTFPLIAKPHDDGCSVMVHKAYTASELTTYIDDMFAHGKTWAMIEEFITGMELTVGVLGNHTAKALPPSQSITQRDILSIEEKFLPGAGENQTPAPLPDHALALVQRTVEKAYTAVGCKGYARIDCFYQTDTQSPTGKERVIILEINTLPAMTPATCLFHQAAEINIRPMEFIDKIIQLGLQEHSTKVKVTTPTVAPAKNIEVQPNH